MTPAYEIFPSAQELAIHLADEIKRSSNRVKASSVALNIALSGGNTPKILFQTLAQPTYLQNINWKALHFFWGDERCVPPDHPESNYGMAWENLLQYIKIPESNIHRMRGEISPESAAEIYSNEIRKHVPSAGSDFPRFDWIFLGMGEDGHTASLFPGSELLEIKDKICAVSTHPLSGQKRVTLTLPVINNAGRISFLVTGESKKEVVMEILHQKPGYDKYPAALVNPAQGELKWLLDSKVSFILR